jgi:GTP-binding protein EngB required for normal cell division/ribosomal protein S17E
MDKPKPKFETYLDGVENVFQENKSLAIPELVSKATPIDQYIFYVFMGNSKCGKSELISSLIEKQTIVDFPADFESEPIKFYVLDDSENVIYVDFDGFSFECADEDLEKKIFKFIDSLPNNILNKYNETFNKALKLEKSNFLYVILNDNTKLSLDYVILCNYLQRKIALNVRDRNMLFYLVYSKFDSIEDKTEKPEAKKESILNDTLNALNHYCDSKSEIIFFVSAKPEERYKDYNDFNRLKKFIQSSFSLMKNGLYQIDSDIIKIAVCGTIGSGKSSLIKEIGVVGDVPIGKDIIKTYDHKDFMNIKFYDNPDGLVSEPNNFSFVYQFNSVILVIKDAISDNYYHLIKTIDTFNECNPEHRITLFLVKTYLDKEIDAANIDVSDALIENYKNQFKEQSKLEPVHKNNLYCISLGDKYLKEEYLASFNKDLKKFIDEWFDKALSEKQTENVKKFNSDMSEEKIKKIREDVSGFSTRDLLTNLKTV